MTVLDGDPVRVPAWVRRDSPAPAGAVRLHGALRGRQGVDASLLANLAEVTVAFERLAGQLSHRAVLGPILGHLGAITSLLAGTLAPSMREELCSRAGETAVLAGQVLWHAGCHDDAVRHLHDALELAVEAGDGPLGAYALGQLAISAFRPVDRIRLLDGGGYGFHPRDAPPATRAWLTWVVADAAAVIGDTDRCLASYDLIQGAFARTAEDVAPRPAVVWYLPEDLPGDFGGSMARLRRHRQARAILTGALDTLSWRQRKQRAWLLTSLARTYLDSDELDPDEAARVSGEALTITRELGSKPIEVEIRRLSRELQPWAARPAVAGLRALVAQQP